MTLLSLLSAVAAVIDTLPTSPVSMLFNNRDKRPHGLMTLANMTSASHYLQLVDSQTIPTKSLETSSYKSYFVVEQYANDKPDCGGEILYTDVVSTGVCYYNILYDIFVFDAELYIKLQVESDGETFTSSMNLYTSPDCSSSSLLANVPFGTAKLGCQPLPFGTYQYSRYSVSNTPVVPPYTSLVET